MITWVKLKLTEFWQWLFPEAKAMAVNSKLLFLAIKHSGHKADRDVGDCISVQPADYSPSPEVKAQYLIVDSELTVAEAKSVWLKSGVPDNLQAAHDQETARFHADTVRLMAEANQLGEKDIVKYVNKNITPFDESKRVNPADYKRRAVKLDLTGIDSTTLSRIQDGHTCLNNNRSAAKQKAHDRVMEKYATHKGRTLTTAENAKQTKDILDEYRATAEEVAAGTNKTKDELYDEIVMASVKGREEIEHAELAKITLASAVTLTTTELESLKITK